MFSFLKALSLDRIVWSGSRMGVKQCAKVITWLACIMDLSHASRLF